jgi:hypothetical protein
MSRVLGPSWSAANRTGIQEFPGRLGARLDVVLLPPAIHDRDVDLFDCE